MFSTLIKTLLLSKCHSNSESFNDITYLLRIYNYTLYYSFGVTKVVGRFVNYGFEISKRYSGINYGIIIEYESHIGSCTREKWNWGLALIFYFYLEWGPVRPCSAVPALESINCLFGCVFRVLWRGPNQGLTKAAFCLPMHNYWTLCCRRKLRKDHSRYFHDIM